MELSAPLVVIVGVGLSATMALLTSFSLGPSTTASVSWRFALSGATALGIALAVAAALGWWRAVGLVAGRVSPWGLVSIVLYWFATVAVAGFEGVASRPAGVLLLLVAGIFFGAFGEEVIFRGIVLHGLTRSLGGRVAVAAGSLMFAVYHLPVIVRTDTPAGEVPLVLLAHFGFGVFMCRIRAETETLWFSIGVHTLSNIVVIALWVDPSDQLLTPFGVLDAAVILLGILMALGLGIRRLRPRPADAPTQSEILKLMLGVHVRSLSSVHGRAVAEMRKPGERGLFARFTEPSRRAVIRAQEEARLRGDDHIGTGHLLVGVIVEADATAAEALGALGVRRERFATLEAIVSEGWAPLNPPIPFTPRAKAVFERALLAAIELAHPTIEPSHLLLGLVRQERSDDGAVLRDLDIDRDQAETTVLQALARRSEVDHDVSGSGVVHEPTANHAGGVSSAPTL
jgi:membrane protease YdiL (CAAX protease family)